METFDTEGTERRGDKRREQRETTLRGDHCAFSPLAIRSPIPAAFLCALCVKALEFALRRLLPRTQVTIVG